MSRDIREVRSRLMGANRWKPGLVAVWKIKAECDNADLCGSHKQRELAVVEGTYEEAVDYALTLPNFIGWGRGGDVVKSELPKVIKVDKASLKQAEIDKLREELCEAQKRCQEIQLKLDVLVPPAVQKTYQQDYNVI